MDSLGDDTHFGDEIGQRSLIALIDALRRNTEASQAAARVTLTQPAQGPTIVRTIHWNNMPALSAAEPEKIDSWFIEFETRLRAAAVFESDWIQKFMECSVVPESFRASLRATPEIQDARTYGDFRRAILKKHGPVMPTAYFKLKMHQLRCETAAEAKEQLEMLLVLHNRAAKDAGIAELQSSELAYCFIVALPQPVGRALHANFALAADSENPLERLYQMAKGTENSATATFLAAPEAPPAEESLPGGAAAELVALLAQALKKEARPAPRRPLPTAKRPRTGGNCNGCGGHCTSRANCPASSVSCNKCGRQGHFARVCRSGAAPAAQFTPAPALSGANSMPQRPFRQGRYEVPKR